MRSNAASPVQDLAASHAVRSGAGAISIVCNPAHFALPSDDLGVDLIVNCTKAVDRIHNDTIIKSHNAATRQHRPAEASKRNLRSPAIAPLRKIVDGLVGGRRRSAKEKPP